MNTSISPARLTALLALAALLPAAAAPVCSARSGAPPLVVELYTSEGCSSCPPADQWLSTLKGRPDVLALAFHVNYWDKLGWPDRFASPEITARQHALVRQQGGPYVYTPQVVVGGRDWRDWPRLPKAGAAAAGSGNAAASPVEATLARDGELVSLQIAAYAGAPRLAGYWAVLEDAHQSKVRAGENAGETLRHDHVVRLYQPLPAWTAAAGTQAQLRVAPGQPQNPRRVVFVVTDAATQLPLQAVQLGC